MGECNFSDFEFMAFSALRSGRLVATCMNCMYKANLKNWGIQQIDFILLDPGCDF